MFGRILKARDFASTVVAVPPIALDEKEEVATEPNRALVRHLEDGGVRILLYGGNANLYHFDLPRYGQALDMMRSAASDGTSVITSIGPDYGKALDQAPLVERAGIANVMLLPMAFPADSDGVVAGVRRIADRLGAPLILYLRRDGYIHPASLQRLVAEGVVSFVKYAVDRENPEDDHYLDAIISEIGREFIASGMGETPILDHVGRRGLATFTSGAVCIAPRAAMQLLTLLKSGRLSEVQPLLEPFLAFERARDKFGGIRVLHDAVSMAVAPMGPLMPFVSNLSPEHQEEVQSALKLLQAAENAAA